jgi:hypothetical protein
MMVRGARCMKVYRWYPSRAWAENGVLPNLQLGNEGGNGGGTEAYPTAIMSAGYCGAMSPFKRAAMIRAAI